MSEEESETALRPPRRGWLAAAGRWAARACLAAAAVAVAVALWALVQPISAPQWVREHAASRLSAAAGGRPVRIDALSFGLGGASLQLHLRGAAVGARGDPLSVRVAAARLDLGLAPLLRGEFLPRRIDLAGVRAALNPPRDAAGGARPGGVRAVLDAAAGVPAALRRAEAAALAVPALAELEALRAEDVALSYGGSGAAPGWAVNGERIALARQDGALLLQALLSLDGAQAGESRFALSYRSALGEPDAEIGVEITALRTADLIRQEPSLRRLASLDAPVSGAFRARVGDSGALEGISATLSAGPGALRPGGAARAIPFERVQAYFDLDPETGAVELTSVDMRSDWLSGAAEGAVRIVDQGPGRPPRIVSQLRIGGIQLGPALGYDPPVDVDSATLEARVSLDPLRIEFSDVSATRGGAVLRLFGEARAEADGWHARLDGRLGDMPWEEVNRIWPAGIGGRTRAHLEKNLERGVLRGARFAARLRPGAPPQVHFGADFDGVRIRPLKGAPMIERGRGSLELQGRRFAIAFSSGAMQALQGGSIDVSGSSLEVVDVTERIPTGVMRLAARSSITAALSFLDSGDMAFMRKAGREPDIAEGDVEIRGTVTYPLRRGVKIDEIDLDLEGRLLSARSDKLIPRRTLSAPELALRVVEGRVSLSGSGALGGVPASGTWSADLIGGIGRGSRFDGELEVSGRLAEEFGIGLPEGAVFGRGAGRLSAEFARGEPARFRLESDLDGVGIAIGTTGWTFGRTETGRLEVAGTLGERSTVDSLAVEAGGLRIEGDASFGSGGSFERLTLGRIALDGWIDVAAQVRGRGPGAAPAIEVVGGEVDLTGTRLAGFSSGGLGALGMPVSVRLDRLRLSELIALTEVAAELKVGPGAQGAFSARIDGGARITGRIAPPPEGEGGNLVEIAARDAGAFFRSAGIASQVHGGELALSIQPGSAPGAYAGRLDVTGARVRNAPPLAGLLNAVSIVGLLEQLNGEGIAFSDIEADFALEEDRVVLYSGKAVGASMGISMEGYYYPRTGHMDMEGVLSPLYLLNVVGRVLSREGEGLFGFQYGLRGPSSGPNVEVNPVSALLPGPLREFFRRPPPKPPEEDAAEAGQT